MYEGIQCRNCYNDELVQSNSEYWHHNLCHTCYEEIVEQND